MMISPNSLLDIPRSLTNAEHKPPFPRPCGLRLLISLGSFSAAPVLLIIPCVERTNQSENRYSATCRDLEASGLLSRG